MTLRELLTSASNDYSALEERYRAETGGELVLDPFGSLGAAQLTRSATVMIGAHNSRESLRRSLASIAESSLNLRHPELLEVIVVDDGSTDGTWEMLAGLDLGLRLHCIRQRRGGLTNAHNTGLAFASGDVVVFSDADIVHTPLALEELLRRHEVLPAVTLVGFRFDIDAGDQSGPWELAPAFWGDFRLSFPGVPASICRETRHLKDLGHGRRVAMTNGARYDLPAMVVGAFFSIERAVLLAMGGSEERLLGWGCEDSLIGARSIALGNAVVPVYGAASAHVAHPRRDRGESEEFARNIRTATAILHEPFEPPGSGAVAGYGARALEHLERMSPPERREVTAPRSYPFARDDHANHGLVAWSLGCFAEAAEAYARAATDEPTAPWPALGRAKALRELGRLDEALDAFAQAGELDPSSAWVAWERGLTHAARGDGRAAQADFEEARALSPGFFEPAWALGTSADDHKRRANEHAAQSLHRIALRDFDLSIAADEHLPWTHFDRGLTLHALGRADEALAEVRRACELLHPDDANQTWVHGTLGELHLERGELAPAKLELERALRLFPANEQATAAATRLDDAAEMAAGLFSTLPLLRKIADIPGWLSDPEADLLSACVVRAVPLAQATRGGILELGSFYGRSTVTIALTLQALGAEVPFTAVDPHENYEFGGVPESYVGFLANLRSHGVEELVNVVKSTSHELSWTEPLALLFVDALHDYENVRRDHELFERFLVPGGLVAFHDYFEWCPGVRQYVDELLAGAELELAGHRDRLIVLRRPSAPARGRNGRQPRSVAISGATR